MVVGALALLCASCRSGSEAVTTTDASPTSEPAPVDSTIGTTTDDDVGEAIADLQPAQPASFSLDPSPPPEDILAGLAGIDWAAVFEGDDPAEIRSQLVGAVREAADLGSAGLPRHLVDRVRDRRMRGGSPAQRGAATAETTSEEATQEFDNGTISGTLTGTTSQTIDPVTARRTIVVTIAGDAVDSATGQTKHAEVVLRFEHDLCWNTEGIRTGSYEQTVTVTVDEDGTTQTSTGSRRAGATEDPSSSEPDYTWGAARDGNSASASGSYPGAMGPGNTASRTAAPGGSETFEWDNGYQMQTSGSDPVTIAELSGLVGDYNNFVDEFAFATPPSRVDWEEFCLRVTVEPEVASLHPDGDVLGITVQVTDWTDTPLPEARVRVRGATLGAFTGPTSGESDHNGEFATLYTSDQEGTEEILIPVAYAGFEPFAELTIQIGPAWALTMTMDIEDVTFLWDGLFSPGQGLFDGDGIGTIIGEGRCEVTSSAGSYTGPIAQVGGTFTFTIEAEHDSDDDGEWFTIEVTSSEAEVDISYEDPACGGFTDIARGFFEIAPTFTNGIRRPGMVVQVTEGFGTIDVPFDPYVLEVEVRQLGAGGDGG